VGIIGLLRGGGLLAEVVEFTTLAGDDFTERQGGADAPEGYPGEPNDDAYMAVGDDGIEA